MTRPLMGRITGQSGSKTNPSVQVSDWSREILKAKKEKTERLKRGRAKLSSDP